MKAKININDIEEIMFWNISGNSGWQVKYIDGNLDTISSPESDFAFQRFIQTHKSISTPLAKSQGYGEVITWNCRDGKDAYSMEGMSIYEFKVTKSYITVIDGKRVLENDVSYTSATYPVRMNKRKELEICEDIRKLESARNPGMVIKVELYSVLGAPEFVS